MAHAYTKGIEVPQPPKIEERVVLELSRAEAECLLKRLRAVAKNSQRHIIEALAGGLHLPGQVAAVNCEADEKDHRCRWGQINNCGCKKYCGPTSV